MSDWTDDPGWKNFVETVRRDALTKIAGSTACVSIAPDGDVDIKFAVELGIGIMLDKPLIVLVMPGRTIPEHLRRVADEVVFADIDTEEGRSAFGKALLRLGIGVDLK